MLAASAIFRDDLLRRRGNSEIHHAAEQQHPGPDIDIDAVIRAAHPARQQDLRQIRHGRADDADDEHRAGEASCDGSFAAAAEQAGESSVDSVSITATVRNPEAAEGAAMSGPTYQLFVKNRLGASIRGDVKASNPESRDSPMCNCTFEVRATRA